MFNSSFCAHYLANRFLKYHFQLKLRIDSVEIDLTFQSGPSRSIWGSLCWQYSWHTEWIKSSGRSQRSISFYCPEIPTSLLVIHLPLGGKCHSYNSVTIAYIKFVYGVLLGKKINYASEKNDQFCSNFVLKTHLLQDVPVQVLTSILKAKNMVDHRMERGEHQYLTFCSVDLY